MTIDNRDQDRREEDQRVGIDLTALRGGRRRDYLVRFAFGAGIALVAGLAGLRFGPKVGGLFLAFPAVLPTALTLIAKKESDGIASIDALGGVLGALGMIAFAATAFTYSLGSGF